MPKVKITVELGGEGSPEGVDLSLIDWEKLTPGGKPSQVGLMQGPYGRERPPEEGGSLNPIVVIVEGGIVQKVTGVPRGYKVLVRDLVPEGETPEVRTTWINPEDTQESSHG